MCEVDIAVHEGFSVDAPYSNFVLRASSFAIYHLKFEEHLPMSLHLNQKENDVSLMPPCHHATMTTT